MTKPLIAAITDLEINELLGIDLLDSFSISTPSSSKMAISIYRAYSSYISDQLTLADRFGYKLRATVKTPRKQIYSKNNFKIKLSFEITNANDVSPEFRKEQRGITVRFARQFMDIKRRVENELFIENLKHKIRGYRRISDNLSIRVIGNISAECLDRYSSTNVARGISEHELRAHFGKPSRTSKSNVIFESSPIFQKITNQFITETRKALELLDLAFVEFKYLTLIDLVDRTNKASKTN